LLTTDFTFSSVFVHFHFSSDILIMVWKETTAVILRGVEDHGASQLTKPSVWNIVIFLNVENTSIYIHRSIWHRVSKGVEDSRRAPAQQAGHPRNSCKAVKEVA
jgi:hypothetical protein